MADMASEGSESNQEDVVNFDDPESLRKTYENLCNSYILSKAYNNLRRNFRNLSKDHLKLAKTFQD